MSEPRSNGYGAVPLLYWFLVLTGLAALTVLRVDEARSLVPIWFGSIVGVSLGHIVGLLRFRVWFIAAAGFGSMFILAPTAWAALTLLFGDDVGTVAMVLVPAAVCGYASLTERGGLLAFWFPAMLWMLVILDSPTSEALSADAVLPFVIGLAAVFIALLRARETRRVALWRDQARVRLATPGARSVLRTSPARGVVNLAWTLAVGAGALLLAAWIAPLLWEKEELRHAQSLAVQEPPARDPESGMVCCVESSSSTRVSEYLPLTRRDDRAAWQGSCVTCSPPKGSTWEWTYEGTPGSGLYGIADEPRRRTSPDDPMAYGDTTVGGYPAGWSYGATGYGTTAYGTTAGDTYGATGYDATGYAAPAHGATAYDTPTHDTPAAIPEPAPAPAAAPPEPAPAPPEAAPDVPAAPAETAPAPPPPPRPVAVTPPPRAPAEAPSGMPIAGVFLLCIAGVVAHLLYRAARRALTMRHLERPFWPEPLDQRVSNHWQRMLIGLQDAGIHPGKNEQPLAFARRVGILGMKECATILERVRHGVRVEASDLSAMSEAASAVYRSARGRAGLLGKLAASVRWPLV